MMKIVSIRNWDTYQHYKHRNPPWVKLHVQLMSDYHFLNLDDACKLHLFASIMLAARYQNEIPDDPEFLQKIMCLSEPFKIDALVNAGWLVRSEQNASKALAGCKQDASKLHQNCLSETETETETETEKKRRQAPKFSPPTTNEVAAYCTERGNTVDPAAFVDYYESVNWHVGKKSMSDWRAAVRTWEKRNAANQRSNGKGHRTRAEQFFDACREYANSDADDMDCEPVRKTSGEVRPQVVEFIPRRHGESGDG